jgi:hypothetical protein
MIVIVVVVVVVAAPPPHTCAVHLPLFPSLCSDLESRQSLVSH